MRTSVFLRSSPQAAVDACGIVLIPVFYRRNPPSTYGCTPHGRMFDDSAAKSARRQSNQLCKVEMTTDFFVRPAYLGQTKNACFRSVGGRDEMQGAKKIFIEINTIIQFQKTLVVKIKGENTTIKIHLSNQKTSDHIIFKNEKHQESYEINIEKNSKTASPPKGVTTFRGAFCE